VRIHRLRSEEQTNSPERGWGGVGRSGTGDPPPSASVLGVSGAASTREERSGRSSDKNRMISSGGKRRNIRRLNVYGHLGQLFRAQRYMNK